VLLGAGALTKLFADDDSNVNSWIGPSTGNTSGGTPASVNASGNVTVGSLLDSRVNAEAKSMALSLGGAIGLIEARAQNTADVRSYLGDAAQVTATGNDVSFTATSHSFVYAQGFGLSGALAFGASGLLVTASMTPSISAFTESGGSISARPLRPRRRASHASGHSASSTMTWAGPCSVAIWRSAKARCRPR